MKRVTFEIAKAIKEAGYPQKDYGHHYSKTGAQLYGAIWDYDIYIPKYLDVWLWLWREKRECINIMTDIHGNCRSICDDGNVMPKFADPEEAIIAAIEYLVNNDLIK